MRLRLTLLDPTSGRATDLRVEARHGARLNDLLDALDLRDVAGPAGTDRPAGLNGLGGGRRGSRLTCSVDSVAVPGTAALGVPPLLDGAQLTLRPVASPAPMTAPGAGTGLLQLHAVAGPDTGIVHELQPGRHHLGRGAHASIRVGDPSLSRIHAEIVVAGRTVTIRDLESTNGTWVDGIRVGREPAPVATGATVRTGDSEWQLRSPSGVAAATRPDQAGHLLVSRSPRLPEGLANEPITFPESPSSPAAQRLPLLAAVLPIAFSGVLALVMHSPTMLLFGLMGPLLLLASWLSDRRAGRRTSRAEQRRYAAATARATAQLTSALAAERARRIAADPDPALLGCLARGPLSGLWDRTGQSPVRVRLGVGTVRAEQRVVGAVDPVTIPHTPIVIDLDRDAATGIVGPRETTVRLARWLVGQLALRYSPTDLGIVVLAADGRRDWEWVSDLPHWRAADDPTGEGRVVVINDGDPSSPILGGAHVLALAATREGLPTACERIIDLTDAPKLDGSGPPVSEVIPDGVPQAWATLLARRLGPLRDAADPRRHTVMPSRTTLLELLALPERDGLPDLTSVWRDCRRSTLAPIGATADGPVVIDLVRDGPHALVGGTTGSGKSELLVSLVASLAAANRPEELSFVLVDYKGGAAFGACRDLPHVVGLVTDLDPQLTERALISLDAELKRRERIFAERGVADLAAYLEICRDTDPTVGRLVIVVDEFRSLAEELPDFVTGLVRVASLGRSLGVHLVVATQRPGGVVTADMRANLGLRIALRVRDAIDSLDVIESPAAASISQRTPGRAIITSAATPFVEVQTALATAASRRGNEPMVRLLTLNGLPLETTDVAAGPTDLDDLVAASRRAMSELHLPMPSSPWLPPLSGKLTVADLATGEGWPVPIGRRDLPALQRQEEWTWDAQREGHLAIVGAPRTGRSSALLTVATQLATRLSPNEVHLYAVHTGAMSALDSLPHVGASVRCDDLPRLARLLGMLHDAPAADGAPLRILVVDDWDRIGEELDRARAGLLRDRLAALLRHGPRERIAVCLTGGRSLLSGALGQLVPRRLLLLPADPVDLAMAGLSSAAVAQHPTPGRAVDLTDGAEVQLAAVVEEPSEERRTAYLREIGGAMPVAESGRGPRRVPLLPAAVSLGADHARTGFIPVGTDGEEVVGFEPERGERRVAVLGPRGSGRTTALRTIAAGLAAAGRVVAVLGSATDFPSAAMRFEATQVDALVKARQAHPDLAVLVDDAERLTDPALEAVLREIVRLVDTDGGLVVVASTTQEAARNPRSLANLVAGEGVGILLGPVAPGEEAVFGLRGTLLAENHPGRGHLIQGGRASPIQVATHELPAG